MESTIVDPYLLPLAEKALACYDDDVVFAWQGEMDTSHLLHTTVDGIHTFMFAGTMPDVQEWMIDIFAIPVPVPGVPEVGDVHAGFAIGACRAVYDYILPTLVSLGYPSYFLGGHSKGAAQAGQAYGLLKVAGHPPTVTRLYEPPYFGGQELADLMTGSDIEWTETHTSSLVDVITRVPVGPSWRRSKPPIRLEAPDDTDVISLHKMPAVIAAIKKLNS